MIPARMAATRLPGKPLLDIAGSPMIVQVWRRAIEADVGPVVVACDDSRIFEAVRAAGGVAVMTRDDHASRLGPDLRGRRVDGPLTAAMM